MILNRHMMAALVTLVTKYIRLQSPLKQKDFVAFELQVCARSRLGEEVKATLCVFAQQCVQPASESASGQAKGRTAHQRIHRTTECFLGGGWDSEREGSKKSLSNYLQLWACFCAISHTIFFIVVQDVIANVAGLKVQQWHDNGLSSCKLWIARDRIGTSVFFGDSVGLGKLRRPGLKPE